MLRTSCGSFQLAADGSVSLLPRHWLAQHAGGTGRRYGAHLDLRRTHPGGFLLVLKSRVVWRSTGLYPRDGGAVAFGPHAFAFASYRHGVYLTDMHGAERLVARGRGLYPYSFTGGGDLIVTGTRTIALISPSGAILRRFAYRPANGYGFDEQTDTLYYVTPAGRLAAAQGTHVELGRSLAHVDGMLSVARPRLLVFSGAHSITAATRDGTVIATAHWRSPGLNSDAGMSVSPDGNAFAFRLSDAHPGAHSSTATVYLLRAGATRAQPIYQHRLGPSGCAVGAGFSWHGSSLLYSSSDGTLAVFDTRTHATTNLTVLAAALPHRSPAERALAGWRSDFRR
jgi:WD40 repeat protein